MGRKRTSKIWLLEESEFIKLTKNSRNMSDMLRKLNMSLAGNIKTIKQRIQYLNIDVSHLKKLDLGVWLTWLTVKGQIV